MTIKFLKTIFFSLIFLHCNILLSDENDFINKKYDDDTYYGQYKNGVMHGLGKYTWADGDYYIGEIKNGKFHYGIYYYKDNKKYCGEFLNDGANGFSVFYFNQNETEKYAGNHKKGKRNGLGGYFYKEGDIVYGEWSNDDLNGYAIGYNSNNKIIEQGIYKNDKLEKRSNVGRSLIEKIKDASIKGEANCAKAKIIVKEYLNKAYEVNSSEVKRENNIKTGGIGITIEKHEEGFKIVDVVRGYPAFNSGLKKDDIIYSIDDIVIGKNDDINLLVNLITGKIFTKVKIVVVRNQEIKVFNIERRDISGIINSDKNNSDNLTYCKKKDGEIYIPQNQTISRDYCYSGEKVTTKNEYEKYINSNTYINNKEFLKKQLDTVLADIKTLNKRIYENIEKLDIINNNFNPKNYLEDIFYSNDIYEIDFNNNLRNFNKINLEIDKLFTNFILVEEKKKIISKIELIRFSLDRSKKLLENYDISFSEYDKNKKERLEYKNKSKKNEVIILDIEGIFYAKNNLNLRMGPNVQSTILITIPQGGVVEVLRVASGYVDWVQVKYKDVLGYVYFPLLSKEKVEVEEIMSINDELQIALDYLRDTEYEQAKDSLENIISNFPSDELAGIAYYWLGELFVLEKNYRESALIFAEGFQKFPESGKAADTLYKLAISLEKLDKINEACKTLDLFLSEFPKDKLIAKINESLDEWECPLTTNVIKNKLNAIDSEEDNTVLNNIYYNDLIKIKELIDLDLITLEEYEKRKIQIIDQIINLDLSNRAGFLIKLLNENLITQDDFQYIFNNLSSSLNIEEDQNLNIEEENFSIADILKEVREEKSSEDENKNEVRKRGDNKKEDEIVQTLSVNEIDVLRQQLTNCWNAPAGAIIDVGMFVSINTKVLKNGNVVPNSVRLIDTNISKSNPFYEPITDSAMRTLLNPECTPLNLPSDKYEQWKNITITFDYSIMKGY